MRVSSIPGRRCFGVIGGLGPLASADVFFKLVKSTPALSDADHFDVIFEQRSFAQAATDDLSVALTERKLYVFDMIREFERRGVNAVVLPCFLSHTFMTELKAESNLPIVDMLEALRAYIARRFPAARRIGVLTSQYVRDNGLFERYFAASAGELVYPRPAVSGDAVDLAVYGPQGIKAGKLLGAPVELLHDACLDLIAQGVDLIVPGVTELSIVLDALGDFNAGNTPVPILDSNLIYAQYAVSGDFAMRAKPFKVGVVGGVGPAATADFMQKIIRNTPAARDQDHIKLLIEQNPQIPDRTANLLGDGPDPTIALYATCKKLEAGDADLIAIPCNTAHAFVERIQPHLRIPIVNMLTTTAEYLARNFAQLDRVGLLATSGTLDSGVYAKALAAQGYSAVEPDSAHQARVMNAIYGPQGVKAGYTSGTCMTDILAAVDYLLAQDIEVIILGCTELPLLFADPAALGGRQVQLIDPTDVLARQCVTHALSAADFPR